MYFRPGDEKTQRSFTGNHFRSYEPASCAAKLYFCKSVTCDRSLYSNSSSGYKGVISSGWPNFKNNGQINTSMFPEHSKLPVLWVSCVALSICLSQVFLALVTAAFRIVLYYAKRLKLISFRCKKKQYVL